MPAKPSMNNCGDATSLVNRHLGTAYDNVKLVSDSIDEVIAVSGIVDDLTLYLGAHTEPPTTDKFGNPLRVGSTYWNLNVNLLYYWDGSEWVENSSVLVTQEYIVDLADGQTVVTAPRDLDNVVVFVIDSITGNERLVQYVDFTVAVDNVTITLNESYNSGSKLYFVFNDIDNAEGYATDLDITEAQEDLLPLGSSLFKGDDRVTVKNGDTVPSGTTHLRVLVDGKPTILVAWDSLTLPATITSVPISDNGFAGYDIVTDQGTFEFTSLNINSKRLLGDPLGFGLGSGGDDTLRMNRFFQELLENGINAKSSTKEIFNLTDTVLVQGDGSQKLLIDLNGSEMSFITSTLRCFDFKDLDTLTIKNVDVNCNNGANFGFNVTRIKNLFIEPSCVVRDILETTDTIIIGVRIEDCMYGCAKPTVKNIVNSPVTSGVGRGVLLSDNANLECYLTLSPTIENIPGTADGDGVFVQSVYETGATLHKGGLKIIGGTYKNCGKRNIKSHLPNVEISGNRGRNTLGTPMFAFVSAYGGSSQVCKNNFECDSTVDYKVETGNILLDSSIGSDYIVDGNIFKSLADGSQNNRYLISLTEQTFGSVTVRGNVDYGSGRLVRGLATPGGKSLKLKGNVVYDANDSLCNLPNITLESLDINSNYSPDVASRYLVVIPSATITKANIINNVGDFGFGTLQADASFRPQNMYGNGSNVRQTSDSLSEFKSGIKYTYRNNSEPTSGEFLVGDQLINNFPSPTGWASKICTTSGAAGTTAVFKIDRIIED